jgi:hypothetical protein
LTCICVYFGQPGAHTRHAARAFGKDAPERELHVVLFGRDGNATPMRAIALPGRSPIR